MNDPIYTLRLTEAELWALKRGYDASFGLPDEMSAIERSAEDKLNAAWRKARSAKGLAPAKPTGLQAWPRKPMPPGPGRYDTEWLKAWRAETRRSLQEGKRAHDRAACS